MKRNVLTAIGFLALALAGFIDASAQVKQVEMRIGGYLCGN